MPRKVFTAGEILTAADVNTNLMDQAVMVFDDSAARGSAIPSPSEGMVTYLKDTDLLEQFTGAAFVPVSQPGILQVVSTTKNDTFTSTSTSFVTVTNLTQAITPTSTSSKILIMAQVSSGFGNATAGGNFKVTRGGTDIYVPTSPGTRVPAVYGGFINVNLSNLLVSNSIVFLDSPSTTDSTTYQIEARKNVEAGGGIFVNRASGDSDNANSVRGVSSITLMEVAG